MLNFSKSNKDTTEATNTTSEAIIRPIKDIRPQWKALAASRQITKEDIAAYCIWKSLYNDQIPESTKERLLKSFSPITNKIKLENGADARGALRVAINSLKYSNVAQWLDEDELKLLLEEAKILKTLGLK